MFGLWTTVAQTNEDVIKWKHFPRYWPFVRGIHRSPVNSPHKGQWRGALMFSLICARINGWVNNGEAGDLRHHSAHYDVIVMNEQMRLVCVMQGGDSPESTAVSKCSQEASFPFTLNPILAIDEQLHLIYLWCLISHPCPNPNDDQGSQGMDG